MSYALSSGVTGLQAHQTMLDVAGNNLANVNTTAFKGSRVNFSELLGETMQQASQPTDSIGGTNPQQMGSGVGISGVSQNMGQGSIVNTGNPLDVAVEGEGYFVASNGETNLYTRAGTFAVDENGNMVDPSSGYLVQRMGLTGEADGFQTPGVGSINVPYDVALPATQTAEITITGNVSSDAITESRAHVLTSNVEYTYDDGTSALGTTVIGQLDQFSGGSGTGGALGSGESGTIAISGYHADGTAFSSGLSFSVDDTTTLTDLADHLNNNVLSDATASVVNGEIRLTDSTAGYSQSDIALTYSGTGTLETPGYFEMTTVGGDEMKSVNIAVYDSQGGKHVLSAALSRTDETNTWDMVLTSITGNVGEITPDSRRISGITFDPQTGGFAGMADGSTPQFEMTFNHDLDHPQTVALDFGTVGSFDGLTQFAGNSTAVARQQDGYEAGSLTAVSVSNEGILVGAFSNGIKKDLATLAVGLFTNNAGLLNAGGGYYVPSANSGGAVLTQAMNGGAGTIRGGALEKSNADVANEFVNLIQAQNGFQANARTIRVANEILQELTNLIR